MGRRFHPANCLPIFRADRSVQSAETGLPTGFRIQLPRSSVARRGLHVRLCPPTGDKKLPPSLTSLADEALIAFDNLSDRAANLVNPTIRLGVTGLSRSGKTVFISSLVHNLLHGGRLPLFEAQQSGRISATRLEEQPDDAVPRFQYEDHIRALARERVWPESTRAISELRVTIEYQSASGWNRLFSPGRLSIDIVDYPGEWLLDLPLLGQSYEDFSANTLSLAASGVRAELSRDWLALAAAADIDAPADEIVARELAHAFTPICVPANPTSAPCRPCHPDASCCRVISKAPRPSHSRRLPCRPIPGQRRVRCGR